MPMCRTDRSLRRRRLRFLQAALWLCGPLGLGLLLCSSAFGQGDSHLSGSPHIRSMPQPQYRLQVIENRSQLIVARTRIIRTDVANPTIASIIQYSPTEIAVLGLQQGATSLALWFEGDPNPAVYVVTTIRDPSLEEQRRADYAVLERKIARLFPESRVSLIPLSSRIIVKGQARDPEQVAQILAIVRGEAIGHLRRHVPNSERPSAGGTALPELDLSDADVLVNLLQVPGEFQVMLRVQIAELNRSQLRRMGLDWSAVFHSGHHAVNGGLAAGVPSTLTGIFENGEIQGFLNCLTGHGAVSILSQPVLTVMSGHSASFLSGGEFAVPTAIGPDDARQTTVFRGFGTSLVVTPTVVDRDLIRLRIEPEFSQLNDANSVKGIPGVDARRVATTVQLREGQTIALGGLLARQSAAEVKAVPLLSELPLVGHKLFHVDRATCDETELLILVTPEIVRPLEAGQMPLAPYADVMPLPPCDPCPPESVQQLPAEAFGGGHSRVEAHPPQTPPPPPSMPESQGPALNPIGTRPTPARADRVWPLFRR